MNAFSSVNCLLARGKITQDTANDMSILMDCMPNSKSELLKILASYLSFGPNYDPDSLTWFDQVEAAGAFMGKTPEQVMITKNAASALFARLKEEGLFESLALLLLPGPTSLNGFQEAAIGNDPDIKRPTFYDYDRIDGYKMDGYTTWVDSLFSANDLPQDSRHYFVNLTEMEAEEGERNLIFIVDSPEDKTYCAMYGDTNFTQFGSEGDQLVGTTATNYEPQGHGVVRISSTEIRRFFNSEWDAIIPGNASAASGANNFYFFYDQGSTRTPYWRFNALSLGENIDLLALQSAINDYITAITPAPYERLSTDVDFMITDTSPANRDVYAYRDFGAKSFGRNEDLWAKDLMPRLACASVCNNQGPPNDGGFWRAGTLITPRHAIFAKHYPIEVGVDVYFSNVNGGEQSGEVIAIVDVEDCDFQIGLLDVDITEIIPAALAPTYADLIGRLGRAPQGLAGVATNSAEEWLGTVEVDYIAGGEIVFRDPTNPARASVQLEPISGDSGNPIWLGGCEFLASLWKDLDPDKGDYIGSYLQQISDAIAFLETEEATGYIPKLWIGAFPNPSAATIAGTGYPGETITSDRVGQFSINGSPVGPADASSLVGPYTIRPGDSITQGASNAIVTPGSILDFSTGAMVRTNFPVPTFARASAATRRLADGSLQSVGNNVLRNDYSPTFGRWGYLSGSQKTNLARYSEAFSNGYWSSLNPFTVASNVEVAPDGVMSADLCSGLSGGQAYGIGGTGTTAYTIGVSYTCSVYVRAGATNFIQLTLPGGRFGTAQWSNFNVALKTFQANGGTAGIEDLGNGWMRCWHRAACTSTGSDNAISIVLCSSIAAVRFPALSSDSSVYLWGAQCEEGGLSSYIPSTGGSQTVRQADTLTVSDMGWFNPAEGTFVCEAGNYEGALITAARRVFTVGNNPNIIALTMATPSTSGGYGPFPYGSINTTTNAGNAGTSSPSGREYLTLSYSTADGSFLSRRISSGVVATSGNIGNFTGVSPASMELAANLDGHIRKLYYFPTKLTNPQIESILNAMP